MTVVVDSITLMIEVADRCTLNVAPCAWGPFPSGAISSLIDINNILDFNICILTRQRICRTNALDRRTLI